MISRLRITFHSSAYLHIHATSHCAYTACYGIIRTEAQSHKVIVFVLDARRGNGLLCTELFKPVGQVLRPQHGQVWFRRRPKIGQSLQETERCFGDHASAIFRATTQSYSHPSGIGSKKCVVFWCTEVSHKAHLNNKIINDLLQISFRCDTGLKVLFCVDIEKTRTYLALGIIFHGDLSEYDGFVHLPIPSTDAHGSSILLFEGC